VTREGLPPELYTIWEAYPWRLGEPYCLFKTFLTETTSSASILTITAFTVERYTAICHPLRAHTVSTLPRAARTIVGVWLAACVTALPYPLHTRAFYYLDDPTQPGRPLKDSLTCNIPTHWQSRMRYFFQASFCVKLCYCSYVQRSLKAEWLTSLVYCTCRYSRKKLLKELQKKKQNV